jgi:hypothetical protein
MTVPPEANVTHFFKLLILTSFISSAFAANPTCTGNVQGQSIVIRAYNVSLNNNDRARAQIEVNGAVVGRYDRGNANIGFNVITKNISIDSNQGDSIRGKFGMFSFKKGTINKFYIPGRYNFSKFDIKCF